jgi:hypothetical protein
MVTAAGSVLPIDPRLQAIELLRPQADAGLCDMLDTLRRIADDYVFTVTPCQGNRHLELLVFSAAHRFETFDSRNLHRRPQD